MKRCMTCGKSFSETRSDQMYCSPKCRYRYYHPQKDYLILPIKKQWFDMISAGEKTEDSRNILAGILVETIFSNGISIQNQNKYCFAMDIAKMLHQSFANVQSVLEPEKKNGVPKMV